MSQLVRHTLLLLALVEQVEQVVHQAVLVATLQRFLKPH
jgi:hypothetical protein